MDYDTTSSKKASNSQFGKIVFVAILVVLVFGIIGTAAYYAFFRKPSSPGGSNPPTTYALMALGGDCTTACASNPVGVCSKGITSSTFIALGGSSSQQPLVSIVDGAPTVTFGIPGMTGSYTFPTTVEASSFLTAVLLSKDSSGKPYYSVGMFNASAPTSDTQYPPNLVVPPGGDDGARFASFVANALKPRKDGLTNVALFLVLNGGPGFFASGYAQGFPSPGNSAWNVFAALRSLGPVPVWTSIVPGSPQPYCGCYDFASQSYSESTALPNCVAGLTGTVSL